MKQIALTEEFFEGAVSFEKVDGCIRPWRLPFDRLRLFPPEGGVCYPAGLPAGVRLRFATASPVIGLSFRPVPNETPPAFDLTIDGELIAGAACAAGQDEFCFEDLPGGLRLSGVGDPYRRCEYHTDKRYQEQSFEGKLFPHELIPLSLGVTPWAAIAVDAAIAGGK